MGGSENLNAVRSWLREKYSVEINDFDAVAGGSINETGVITLSDNEQLFLKMQNSPPARFFAAEANGLDHLRGQTTLRVPQVIHAGPDFLLLEYLGNGTPAADYWRRLGEGLAALHTQQFSEFGFDADNYCGRTPQCNTPDSDGFRFFARHRLAALAERAARMGLLGADDERRLANLADNLPSLLPEQPAVLIHGDLWAGNVHCDSRANPCLIDPACYRGWAEADLAMTLLFGGFHREFYRCYEEASGLRSDWRERAPVYNLYHLLNHLILFGSGYLSQIHGVLDRYV